MPAVTVHGTVAVNAEHVEVDALNSGVEVRLREDLTVDLGQSFVRGQQVDGVVARIVWHATKNASLDLITRYDIRSTSFLENTALFRFSTCCWEGGLKYTHRTRPGQSDENSVQVTFEVKMPTAAGVR